MKNAIAIPQGINTKVLLPTIMATLKSILEGIFNFPRVLFGKNHGGDVEGDPPKVTGVKVKITRITDDDEDTAGKETGITISTENIDMTSMTVELILKAGSTYTLSPPPFSNKGGQTIYKISGVAFQNPGVSKINVKLTDKKSTTYTNVDFTYTDS